MNTGLPTSPHQNFESIKHIDENGTEYWEARELMPILEYLYWRDFNNVIAKAITSCKKSGQSAKNHFVYVSKMIKIATGSAKETTRRINNFRLSRYACYLIAQNGDSSKQAIANAQTYFAIQARRQELSTLEEDHKRLFIRQEVKKQNKQLFSTASRSGVKNFGKFNDMGYLGLYGLHIAKIRSKKGIGKDDILDRAGSTELAANLFRITQTDEKIKNEKITGEGRVSLTHFSVASKVRDTIKKIGGTMPEDLPPQEHIKKLKASQTKLLK